MEAYWRQRYQNLTVPGTRNGKGMYKCIYSESALVLGIEIGQFQLRLKG